MRFQCKYIAPLRDQYFTYIFNSLQNNAFIVIINKWNIKLVIKYGTFSHVFLALFLLKYQLIKIRWYLKKQGQKHSWKYAIFKHTFNIRYLVNFHFFRMYVFCCPKPWWTSSQIGRPVCPWRHARDHGRHLGAGMTSPPPSWMTRRSWKWRHSTPRKLRHLWRFPVSRVLTLVKVFLCGYILITSLDLVFVFKVTRILEIISKNVPHFIFFLNHEGPMNCDYEHILTINKNIEKSSSIAV